MNQELTAINAIRALAMDAVERANSGHPGAPMGLAACAFALWSRHLNYDPADPHAPNRDRFVLSNGHASMLLYALLHLGGSRSVTLDEIKKFRQYESATPGHPERGHTDGVEVTTGPLGQGLSMAVGLAMAEAQLRATYEGAVDHDTYVICSDGDLMEGVAQEAASLAGHLGLGRLIVLYDDNQITIDGRTKLAFTEDVLARFEAIGWRTSRVEDGNDLDAVDRAIVEAKADAERPTLIAVRTIIGYGAPNKQDTSSAHGSPLGEEEIARAREELGWPHPPFEIPAEAYAAFEPMKRRAAEAKRAFEERVERLEPERRAELRRRLRDELPEGWSEALPRFESDPKGMATRASSGKIVGAIMAALPEFCGGSADLAGSTKTLHEDFGVMEAGSYAAQNIHFGVREHGMGAIINGMCAHGGVRAFGATFLIFSDYARPTLRLAALMKTDSIMVLTHDSIGLGEDGPTHQPIEQLMAMRAIPNYHLFRPADANETRACWIAAIENRDGPSALVLTRQNVPTLDLKALGARGDARRGAYILAPERGERPDSILIATGSEVAICLKARDLLAKSGHDARVVSMPCWELFARQDRAWRDEVLPPEITARVSVEAGATFGWERYVGLEGRSIGLDRFGASAPYTKIYDKLGITPEAIAQAATELATSSR